MTKKRDTLTLKQQKLVAGIRDNLSGKSPAPFSEVAEKAGYKPASARNAQLLLKSPAVQKRLSSMLAMLDGAARLHLAELYKPEKLEKASARDNAYIYDIIIKNERLLSGQSTENKAISIIVSESIADKNAPEGEKPA